MAEHIISEISSDDDSVNEEQIQYTYIETEIIPIVEVAGDEIEPHHYGMIDREEYERVQDHAEELSGRNWGLEFKCRTYERDLRILKRSMPTRVKDKIRFWKEVATNRKEKLRKWVKSLFTCTTEDDVISYRTPRYKESLEARYYHYELNPE